MTPHLPDTAQTEALLAFWRDAGVDACYLDQPVDRTVFVAPAPPQQVLRSVSSHTSIPGAVPVTEAAAEARRLAATALTLDDLAQAVSQFESCPLRATGARQAVFGRGNPNGSLLVIGEAPGETEDQTGVAFSGEAGKLLDRILAAGGLTDQAFLTNAVFWRPPGNRPPTAEELAICAPFVARTLAILQPKAVLLIGATAAKAVLQTDESLMKLRGQWRDWQLHEGGISAPTLTTFHPAFLLRQPQAKRAVWADILSLMTHLNGNTVEATR